MKPVENTAHATCEYCGKSLSMWVGFVLGDRFACQACADKAQAAYGSEDNED